MSKRLEVKVLHCSACGAPVGEESGNCRHCDSPLSLRDRDLDRVCRACGQRMANAACYCASCGAAVPEQAITPLPAKALCPRCDGALQRRDFATDAGGSTLIECAGCGGLWLAPAVFDHLCRRTEAAAAAWSGLTVKAKAAPVFEAQVRYLACPDCGDRMTRKNWGGDSGVVVDLCRPHGLWFDPGELARVLDFLRRGGFESLQRERAAADADAARRRNVPTALPAAGLGGMRDGFDFALDLAGEVATFVRGLFGDLFPSRGAASSKPRGVILRRPAQKPRSEA